ncbi:hypothetical protein DNU06_17300 [Putridiphycobacter roseus]|uniref:Uncharacterized protein n=1 Tax=Putridiphycobacter roseus TaxID=2219161 RepID=A0A2W1MUV4_9FLAO|nr:SUMF1/EgtB/PvdO family nonheme iron enzyme [Putridiphycobacter roseus]PZE15587.1 hypothetical protein DNU06_17300 [Putridiphycobacter roseus]
MPLKILFISVVIFLQFTLCSQMYYPVPNTVIDIPHSTSDMIDSIGNQHRLDVNAFSISEFVTVAQYKKYLVTIKKDSTKQFYQSQIPKSGIINKKLINEIFKCEALQNEPMPGVSWAAGRNYCKWLTNKAQNNNLEYAYDLPLLSQLVAFDSLYKLEDNTLLCWALNTYDESIIHYSKYSIYDYLYNAKKTDPPSLKRKTIYGSSYHLHDKPDLSFEYMGLHSNLRYEFQDSSSRYVGFRIVRQLTNKEKRSINLNQTNVANLRHSKDTVFVFDNREIEVNISNNSFHGNYTEKYENDNIKVSGEFYHGQRVGVWSVWDKNQVLLVRRNYSHNKKFEFIYPISDYPYKKLYAANPIFKYKKNKKGYSPYFYVEESAVSYSKKIWRVLNEKNEKELFHVLNLESLIQTLINNNVICYFYGNYSDFKTKVKYDSLSILKAEILASDFTRFEIKEQFFFNTEQLMGDTRQLSLSLFKNKTDKYPKYSFYFPNIREYLAQIPLKQYILANITNLDEYFYYRNYRGEIIKISTLKKDLSSDWENELNIITAEHKLWIAFGR